MAIIKKFRITTFKKEINKISLNKIQTFLDAIDSGADLSQCEL